MLKLSDQEKQDVIRYLEADTPLPDKYRFLLFEEKREVELVWNGKTNEVCSVVLPFQIIEHVDEPRQETPSGSPPSGGEQLAFFSTDARGRQLEGWTNKLIWGDNKLILSSLKNGPLREEIEAQGGLKLIYIDPPFDVGADFSMDVEVGGNPPDKGGSSGKVETLTKKPNILEEIAYRDTWGKGADSFIAMIYERRALMRDLLAEDGSIYVHCDWKVNSLIRIVLDEVFGADFFRNELVWHYPGREMHISSKFNCKHDTIYFYAKSTSTEILMQNVAVPYDKDERLKGLRRKVHKDEDGREGVWETRGQASGQEPYKRYVDEIISQGKPLSDVWSDLQFLRGNHPERADYPTQKPESLVERIIKASSNEGDLVADFFCGSGTTAAVAEKLGRKWICTDLGKFAIHTTRKRMIGVQRQRKADGKDYRAFEILNLGKYERQHFVGLNPALREDEQHQQMAEKEAAFRDLILRAYRAEKVDHFAAFHGKKAGRLVAVGPVNLPVTRLFVEELILECRKQHVTRVDVLGFEFEMGLFPNVLDEARTKGIDIAPKYIPAEVFDKRAVERNQVVFHDVAFIEVKPIISYPSDKGGKSSPPTGGLPSVAVQLTDFSVFYSQDSIANAEAALSAAKKAGSRIVIERGHVVKVAKDKDGLLTRTPLTRHWTDWIDYWSVDFDFESKREIIRVKGDLSPDAQTTLEGGDKVQPPLPVWEERWTGDYVFENEWQSFRTRKDRSLELVSATHECTPGRRKLAVKVVDIFGNDTMTIVEVTV